MIEQTENGERMDTALLMIVLLLPTVQAGREEQIRKVVADIAQSGRVLQIGEEREQLADPRKQVPPGAPPLVAFRYFQGADRHRFGKLDLMLDDAGH